ncbi:MAG: hypothetical protein HY290_00135 [Planctomycetia bacterium]|nr:hypothetical protein [Planctomycetia bacterium]
MDAVRRAGAWRLFLGFLIALAAVPRIFAEEKPSALKTAAAAAERVVIAIPEHKASKDGKVDVPPGSRFAIEVQSELRGTGNKSVLIVNGGDEKLHPRYVNGKPYVFLLKRNSEGRGWLNLGSAEIPIKNGKVQWLVDGKVAEEMPLAEFEEFAAAGIEAIAEKFPRRDTLTGNWLLIRSDKGVDAYMWLIELTAKEGSVATAKLLASNKVITASRLVSADVMGNDVHLVFKINDTTFEFRGTFSEGIIRGTAAGHGMVAAVRMEPTDLTAMREKYDSGQPDPHHQEFLQAVSLENPTGALSRFTRRHPLSPLSLSAFQVLVSHAANDARPRDQVEQLAAEYRALAAKWGPRMELQALVDLGGALSTKDYLPDLALEYLTAAHDLFADDTPSEMKKTVEIERGRRLIAAGREAEGVAVLALVRSENPFDPLVLYSLARQAEKDKRTDEALALYGELQVLPLLEQSLIEAHKAAGQKLAIDQHPRRLAARLWIEKHGSTNGLPEWLDGLYAERIRALASPKRPPRTADEGNRTVLCELFTGTASQPSVAAEVAVTALSAAYDASDVVILRYHLHDPAPNPLATEETQERYKMYAGPAAPSIILSGRSLFEPGGNLAQAPAVYRRLVEATDALLKEKTDLKVEVSARLNQGQISITAKGLGLPTFPPSIRLEVVIAEDRIVMPAKNGIRIHEMVVRAMVAGIAGVAPDKGELAFAADVEISKLKKYLARQMADKEASAEAPFEDKPLDLAALHVVAFLQNSETGEIYQVAQAAVAGLAPNAAESKSPATKSGDSKPAGGKSAPGQK